MIRIFYGENRIAIKAAAEKVLGADYEVIEGVDLTLNDLPSVFFGTSLFGDKRKILIKDLGENKEAFSKLPEQLGTPHEVVLFETKLDKRTTTYKDIKDKVEIKEFKNAIDPNAGLVFDIYKMAKRDGKKAVEMLNKIKDEQDPYMFFGLMVSQALKDFEFRQGTKEKRVLLELSKLDNLMKSSTVEPFTLLQAFLLQVSSL